MLSHLPVYQEKASNRLSFPYWQRSQTKRKSPTLLRARQNVSVAGSPGCQLATSKMKGLEKDVLASGARRAGKWGLRREGLAVRRSLDAGAERWSSS